MSVSFSGAGMPTEYDGVFNVIFRAKVGKANVATINDSTTTLLGANATYTGISVSPYGNAKNNSFYSQPTTGNAVELFGLGSYYVFADQAGTLQPQASYSGSTWRNLASVAIVASTLKQGNQDFRGSYTGRFNYTNGGVAQGTFEFSTVFGPGN